MKLSECVVGKQYKIETIENIDDTLRNRLESMGIYQDNIFTLKHTSTMKNTFSISISGTHVALRRDEAELIIVSEV